MVQNWYLELLVSSDTGIKSYWCSKAIKIKKNIRIVILISFILQFHPLRHVMGFLRSHHIYSYLNLTKQKILWTSTRLTLLPLSLRILLDPWTILLIYPQNKYIPQIFQDNPKPMIWINLTNHIKLRDLKKNSTVHLFVLLLQRKWLQLPASTLIKL